MLGGCRRRAGGYRSSAPELVSPHCTAPDHELGGAIEAQPQSCHLHTVQTPTVSPSPAWSKGFMHRHCGDPCYPFCDPFIQDDIDPSANATNPTHGPLALAPLSGAPVSRSISPDAACRESNGCGSPCQWGKSGDVPLTVITAAGSCGPSPKFTGQVE